MAEEEEDFQGKMTESGLADFANANVTATPVIINQVAVGDGNGAPIEPTGLETQLYNELHRHPTTSVTIHPDHPNWVVVKFIIPKESSGYTIRELGIYSDAGRLQTIFKFPAWYKPTIGQGFSFDLELTLIMIVTNEATVLVEDGGSVLYATRAWVKKYVSDSVNWYSLNF